MSKKELDQLFRGKLEEHKMAPSDSAWERVQSSLETGKKRHTGIYWKIAAAILLLLSAGIFLWNPARETQNNLTYSTKDPVPSNREIQVPDTAGKEVPEVITRHATEPTVVPEISRDHKPDTDKTSVQQPAKRNESNTEPLLKKDDMLSQPPMEKSDHMAEVIDEPVNDRVIARVEPATPDKKSGTGKGNTLTYSIEEFSSAKIAEEEESTSQTEIPEETPKKGLKKLWAVVRSVNELDGGLGQLREAKNELLAIRDEPSETN